MICKSCGKETKENMAFCANCGAPVEKDSSNENIPSPAPSSRKNKKSNKIWLVIGSILWVIVVAFITVLVMITIDDKKYTSEKPKQESNRNSSNSNTNTNSNSNSTNSNTKYQGEQVLTCTFKVDTADVSVDSQYVVMANNGIVSNVATDEVANFKDATTMEQYKNKVLQQQELLKDIEHYIMEVGSHELTLTTKIRIDYTKIDINKLMAIDPTASLIIKNGFVQLESIEALYKSMGMTCQLESK